MQIKRHLNSRFFQKTLISFCFLGTLTIPTVALASPPPHEINCHFPLTEPALNVRPFVVTEWANYAVTHAFTYNYKDYIAQFTETKNCFTPAGWAGFSNAIMNSNNLESMKEEKLFVFAKVNGETKVVAQFNDETVEPFWLVRVPITVFYYNDDKNSSQNMTVDLNIKTIAGKPEYFGINQMIAKMRIEPKSIVPQGKPAKPENPTVQTIGFSMDSKNPKQLKIIEVNKSQK